jgi:SpoIID/LytB domain protein
LRLFALLIPLLALAATTALAQPTMPALRGGAADTAPLVGEAVFVFSGRGYGHGVGMSQYGAYGMANAGRSYGDILRHYYTGTEIGRAGRKEVRVLLGEGLPTATVSSTAPFRLRDGGGVDHKIDAGSLVLRPVLRLPLSTADEPAAKKRLVRVPAPYVLRPSRGAKLALDGKQYRGRLEVAVEGRFLRAVNALPLESYLEGVVANEMPHAWPLEALKAQAVAARSYALANLVKGKPFDLYSDERSQVYAGVAGEKARTSQAVKDTAGEVVLYAGKIATTYYFSSSGGKTASAADVFGFDVPYLVSRPDPWDKASPYHTWGPILVGARTLQSKLGLVARVLDAVGVATPSGRLRSFTVQTLSGPEKMPAALLRTSVGLRSTWVTIGVLRLDQPAAATVYGSDVRLTGIARALASPMLAASQSGATWTQVGPLQRETTGVASIVVTPERTLRYRIEVAGAVSPPVLVRVAPRVQLQQPVDYTALAGTVRPRLAGAEVTVERRRGAAWNRVARTTVDTSGSFRARFTVTPASYRARVAPTGLFVEGIAPVLTVSG